MSFDFVIQFVFLQFVSISMFIVGLIPEKSSWISGGVVGLASVIMVYSLFHLFRQFQIR